MVGVGAQAESADDRAHLHDVVGAGEHDEGGALAEGHAAAPGAEGGAALGGHGPHPGEPHHRDPRERLDAPGHGDVEAARGDGSRCCADRVVPCGTGGPEGSGGSGDPVGAGDRAGEDLGAAVGEVEPSGPLGLLVDP